MDITTLVIKLVSGAVGNAAGGAMPDKSLGAGGGLHMILTSALKSAFARA